MDDNVSSPEVPWSRSRYGFAGFWFLSLLLGWFILRLTLFFAFAVKSQNLTDSLRAFGSGFQRDVFVAILQTVLLLCCWFFARNSWFGAKWPRLLFTVPALIFWFVQIFLLFV